MSDKRLTAALAKIAVENDGEALAAARIATKLLADRGLKWTDVAQMITGKTIADVMVADGLRPDAATPTANPFTDIFSGFAAAAGWSKPAEPVRTKRATRYVIGAEIPAHLYGAVRIDDEGKWRGGDMLTVSITNVDGTEQYGPIRVFDDAICADLRKAADRNDPQIVTVVVRQPRDASGRHFPVIVQASVDGPARQMA